MYSTFKNLGGNNTGSSSKPPSNNQINNQGNPNNNAWGLNPLSSNQQQMNHPPMGNNQMNQQMGNNQMNKQMGNQQSQMSNQQQSQMVDVIHITNMEQRNNLIKNSFICVIEVYGTFCNPCKIVAPKFVELANKYRMPNIIFAKEDSELDLSHVSAVPCFMFYKNGKLVNEATIMGGNIRQVEQTLQNLMK